MYQNKMNKEDLLDILETFKKNYLKMIKKGYKFALDRIKQRDIWPFDIYDCYRYIFFFSEKYMKIIFCEEIARDYKIRLHTGMNKKNNIERACYACNLDEFETMITRYAGGKDISMFRLNKEN